MRLLSITLFAVVSACAYSPRVLAQTGPGQGTWQKGVHVSLFAAAGALDYSLYLPDARAHRRERGPMPLLVALHGCHQNAAIFAALTRFHELADRYGFAILFPEQTTLRNGDRCWNWFLPVNQGRVWGEAALIAETASHVVEQYGLDRSRVYLAGLSAGGAMVNILASCYPDLFAAAAIHSGLEYLAASTLWDALDVLTAGGRLEPADSASMAFGCSGQSRNMMPAIVVHGTRDGRVVPINGDQVFLQFAVLGDLHDDGRANRSVPSQPTRRSRARVPGGHTYFVDDIVWKGGVLVRKITVEGMGHAWSGGPPGLSHSDPMGPDATGMFWNFLSRFRRR
ncbi:MAG: PHB depolymerase family esterase [Deltaproteobacteria bacterium]|nr:PHB depolymerase family esterase [Deltaproteobacteria bacterium]